ncbi:MAG: DinB family protein, partial [Bacteroidota bacterium]
SWYGAGTHQPPFMGKLGFMVRFSSRMVLASVQPDRTRKMKTFAIWEPASSAIPTTIVADFTNHQERLKFWMLEATNWDIDKIIISSPANKGIVYSLTTAFELMVTHEARHLEQAREVAALQRSANGALA